MAYDKIIDSAALDAAMTATADAIRAKTGSSDKIEWTEQGFAAAVEGISGGGDDLKASFIGLLDGTMADPVLPEGLTKLGSYALYNNNTIKKLVLPESLTEIGEYALYQCTAITNIKLSSNLTTIADYGMAYMRMNSIALPEKLTNIKQYAFSNCNRLFSVTFPASVEEIATCAFNRDTAITQVTFKGTPLSVAVNAFINCTNLLTINVPWAEGEVANAPWSATKATINYNYTGD